LKICFEIKLTWRKVGFELFVDPVFQLKKMVDRLVFYKSADDQILAILVCVLQN
jgi:hypothetical protein